MPRVGMVTANGTERDVSSDEADPIGVWAQAFSFSCAKSMMRENGTVKKRKRRGLVCVVRTLVMGPRLLESASLSHKCSQGGSRRTEKGRGSSSPLSAS